MKHIFFALFPIILTACSQPPQHSSVPLDMQTVREYQQRTSSAQNNTKAEYWDLNKKEPKSKVILVERQRPTIRPSIHYGSYYYW